MEELKHAIHVKEIVEGWFIYMLLKNKQTNRLKNENVLISNIYIIIIIEPCFNGSHLAYHYTIVKSQKPFHICFSLEAFLHLSIKLFCNAQI